MSDSIDTFDHRDPWHQILMLVFFGSVSMLWFYSISRWTNLINSLQVIYNDWGKNPLDPIPGEMLDEPVVTIQIATYNEGSVVGETIARACSLDWPRDKLFIQVCDDSTEKESIALIENLMLCWREKGFNVERLYRNDRIGYKAGNLQHNFQFIKGDYIAYLDADHLVEPQFLRKTIPHFFDDNGKSKNHIGLVQTPWCYYNTHQNLLTECDALGLDIHHVIEQVGRCCSYNVFGFNGTGGVWRKQAVEDAGGFSWDTVTEDLLLSYKAYMEGYEFVYVRDAPQALEVPSCILAHVQQKQRWTKGFMQVLRMYYADILFSKQATIAVKLEALMHLSGPLQLIAAMTALLAYPYLVFHKIDSFLVKIVSILALTEPVGAALHAVVSKIPGENGHYKHWYSRVARLLTILPYFALRFGMTPFETKAIIEGFLSDDATFHTTPKEGSNSTVPAAKRAKKVVRTGGDDMAAGVGLFLAIHQFIYVFAFDLHMPCHTVFDVIVRALNLMICIGLFTVSAMFFLAKNPSIGERALHSLAKTRHIFLAVSLLAYTVGYMTCFMSGGELEIIIADKHPINNTLYASNDNSIPPTQKALETHNRPLACTTEKPAKKFASVIALGLPRTGSTLMFNFLTELGKHYPNIDNLNLYETFAPVPTMQLPGLTQIVDILQKNCVGLEPGAKSMYQQRFDFQSEEELYERLRQDGHGEIYEPLIAAHLNRYKDPSGWLHYVESIPSTGDYGYVEYKVFDHDLLATGISSSQLIDSMQSPDTKFVINYRRNLLESYVSQKIAEASGNWVGAKTTSDDAITINREEFENYIQAKITYFKEIRDHLERRNIPYSVFEYNSHLGAEPQQRDTLRHLQKLLRLRVDDAIVEDIMASLRRKKQSTVPVKEQIRNWNDVVQWGLDKEKDEDWEDLFASVDNSKALVAYQPATQLACRASSPAKPISSVIALGLPRTGSTLMFNFLTELGKHYPNIDNLNLYETFAPVPTMQLPGLTQIVDILQKNCVGLEPGAKSMYQQRFDFQSEEELYERLRQDGHGEIYEPLIAAHLNRYKDPSGWLHYVESIPSTGDYGYVEYKVFDHDLLATGISSSQLIDSMQSPDTKFVINYRRNLLQSYVSQKIAEASGNWVGAKTTSDDAITINREEFENYIQAKITYFKEIRDHLERRNIPYSVFEYNSHLGAEPQQRDTLRHLQKLLRLRVDDAIVEDIMANLRRKKQSTVPVKDQIRNWNEVVQWGLGKEKDEDWEDLFASVDNSKALVAYQPATQLACRVSSPAKPMSSVIALGLPRTGSTLMFNFLAELGRHYPNIDNLNLYETFAPVPTMQLPGLTQIVDILQKNCVGLEPGAKSMYQQRFDFQSEEELYERLRQDGHGEIYEPLIAAHSNRYKDPSGWLHYVESIPSTGDYGYVEYKVFDHDLLATGISSSQLIDSMQSPDTKFVINYRRNLLESYVSQKIAEASGNWVGAKTTSDDAITINREEFENYIQAKITYFQEIRDHLERRNIPYSVFEYNSHLGAEPQQRDTLRHLQKLLRLRVDDAIVEDIMANLRRKKQSTVPVKDQIRNWNDVVQWGLGKEKDEDWEDLFASVDNSKALVAYQPATQLACRVSSPAKPMSSVIALGLPRTGSTLMFNFLAELGRHYPNIDNLNLYETFAPVPTMQLPGLTQIVDILQKNCVGLEPGAKSMYQQRFDFQSEEELYERLRQDGHGEIYEPLIAAHSNRYKDPSGWLHYVESIPSTGDYGYVEYKVFDHDLLATGISSSQLIDSMQSPDTKFVINYRRNLLESYVSQKIAEASGNWVGAKTTSDDAITINREEFENYIQAKITYFKEIRDHLERRNIPYSVFEYNSHLGAEPQQRDTLRHLQKLLRLRVDDAIVEDIMANLRRKKQSTVPVKDQIRNWNEVVQWGLGKEKDEDWEDLFASVDNSKALVAYQPATQLACRVSSPAKPMSSVIALGLPRTGSTLMFNFLAELGRHYPNIDNLNLYETFAPVPTMQLPGLTQIVDILQKNCVGLEPGAKSMYQQRFDFQSEEELYERLRQDGHGEIYEPLIAAHSNRYKDPSGWLHYVESIPSTGDYGYVEYKVFDHDLLATGISSSQLIDSMQSPDTKFVINYRRNLLESYVSQKIAEASGNWVGAKTTSDDAITINREEFENYIQAKITYFQEIRDHLERRNIPYSVFEYNSHLGAEPQQRDTLRHLQKLLRLRVDDAIVEDIMANLRRKKQSTVPVKDQIRNWNEVVQWGLGKEKDEDWEDLFAYSVQPVSAKDQL